MPRALLLNATFEPLGLVSDRRAVVLVLKRKAEVVERDRAVFRSERTAVDVPSVLRLVSYVRVPHRMQVPLSRRAVFARDDHRCQYCGRPAENLDHVVPRSRGGSHSWDNVVAACRSCNSRKENRLLSETEFVLARRPVMPRSEVWLLALADRVDPAWAPYLRSA